MSGVRQCDGMPRSTDVLHLSAFAAAPHGGNPAGVVLDAVSLTDAQMQSIAAEVGHSETAFVTVPAVGDDPRHVRVRYFSPGAEVPFCGHATIATAVALAERRGAGSFRMETAAGTVTIDTEAQSDGLISASFTSVEPVVRPLYTAVAERLLTLLGLDLADVPSDRPVLEAFAGNWHPIVFLTDQDTFDDFAFDPTAVRSLMDERGWAGTVTVAHERASEDETARHVIETRNLFPVGTITEDPATGSAAASLGTYLRSIKAIATPARLTIHQGRHVGRPSILHAFVPASGGVTVTGTATPIVATTTSGE
jgi:PhzF family phenazine biosynthesis protein